MQSHVEYGCGRCAVRLFAFRISEKCFARDLNIFKHVVYFLNSFM